MLPSAAAVFAIRNLHQRSRLAVASDMVKNLRQVDRPHDLDVSSFFTMPLFLRHAHATNLHQRRPFHLRSGVGETFDNRIAEFLDGPTSQSLATALFAIACSARSSQPLSTARRPPIKHHRARTSGHVKLFIDGLAASGARGSELREDERLIAAYLNHLLEKGVISAPFRPRAGEGARCRGLVDL